MRLVKKIQSAFRTRFVLIMCIVALLAVVGWAIAREDGNGNTIEQDLIAPAGGGRITDAGLNDVIAAAGQPCVGVSQASNGSKLTHGVDFAEAEVTVTGTMGFISY